MSITTLKHAIYYEFVIIFQSHLTEHNIYTGLSKKMDGIWNRYNLKSTGRI